MGVAPKDVRLTLTAMKDATITTLPTPVRSIILATEPEASLVCTGLVPLLQLDATNEAI